MNSGGVNVKEEREGRILNIGKAKAAESRQIKILLWCCCWSCYEYHEQDQRDAPLSTFVVVIVVAIVIVIVVSVVDVPINVTSAFFVFSRSSPRQTLYLLTITPSATLARQPYVKLNITSLRMASIAVFYLISNSPQSSFKSHSRSHPRTKTRADRQRAYPFQFFPPETNGPSR